MHVILQIPAGIDWAVIQKNENVLQEQQQRYPLTSATSHKKQLEPKEESDARDRPAHMCGNYSRTHRVIHHCDGSLYVKE